MSADGHVQVDTATGSLYVHLNDVAVDTTREFGDFRMVDYDRDGGVIGVEFLQTAGGIRLAGLPQRHTLRAVLVANGLGSMIDTADRISTS